MRWPARLISKVLIANRGEIACRVIRACREMRHRHRGGLLRGRPRRPARAHGRRGGAPSARRPREDSYLRADKILEAARATGADAIHPGYGFLSENADFAEACAAAGRDLHRPAAPAPSGPWAARPRPAHGCRPPACRWSPATTARTARGFASLAEARAAAARIGYPVMLKAAAGGGGRGMRLVDDEAKLEAALSRRAARGQGRLRRRHRLPREGGRARPPHRDPGVRRPARQRRPPLRARLLGPAPQPEGDRGGALARHRRRPARRHGRGGGARGPLGRLRRRRHHRDAVRPGARAASTSWR